MSQPRHETFAFDALPVQERYKLLSFSIVPRPIAWISTCASDGTRNLAPFSFFNVVATDPALLVVGFTARPQGKDTWNNIRATRQFTVNLVPHGLLDAMNVSAIEFGPEVDEVTESGVRVLPGTRVACPRLEDAPAAFECELYQEIDLPSGQGVAIGRVLIAHILGSAVIDRARCHIDTLALDIVGRMDNRYIRADQAFALPRLTEETWSAGAGRRGAGGAS